MKKTKPALKKYEDGGDPTAKKKSSGTGVIRRAIDARVEGTKKAINARVKSIPGRVDKIMGGIDVLNKGVFKKGGVVKKK